MVDIEIIEREKKIAKEYYKNITKENEIEKAMAEKNNELEQLVLRVLNNENGKQLLKLLHELFNTPTDMNNPNNNYFRDGKVWAIEYLVAKLRFGIKN